MPGFASFGSRTFEPMFSESLTRAERILQIKDTSQSIKRLPHVTWCPTGPLTRLPLHAAGIYDLHVPTDSRPRVYDYVVSSDTPSLTGLLRSIRSVNVQLPDPKVLVVTHRQSQATAHFLARMTSGDGWRWSYLSLSARF